MDRLATLTQRASGLNRSIWASLPWGYRLATVFLRLADASMADLWGRQLGALFLQAGVTDMPPPGPRWNPARPNPGNLPAGYLRREAMMAYQVALKKIGNPQDAEDVVQDALLKVMEGGTKVKAAPLKSALSYFVTSVGWAADNLAKRKRNRRTDSPKEDEDGEGESDRDMGMVDKTFDRNPYWYDDPGDYRLIERLFSPATWERKVKPALARIHPAMPEFFDMLLDSPNPNQGIQEVLRNLPGYPEGATRNGYVNWLNWLKKKVAPLLRELAETEGDGPAVTTAALRAPKPIEIRVKTQMETEAGTIPVTIIGEVTPEEGSGRDEPTGGGVESVKVVDAHGKEIRLDKDDKRWAEDEVIALYNKRYRSASAEQRQGFVLACRQVALAARAAALLERSTGSRPGVRWPDDALVLCLRSDLHPRRRPGRGDPLLPLWGGGASRRPTP